MLVAKLGSAPITTALALALLATGCLGERGGTPAGEQGAAAADLVYGAISDDVPLPLGKLLGLSPQAVEAQLGPPLGKGIMKKSCFRMAPKRTFFTCAFASQTYSDKTGTFTSVTIDYEDGISARVAFNGLPGEGPLTWEEALTIAGLDLPEPPEIGTPEAGVTVWRWYNNRARLVIDGAQHRVTISTVDGERKRARIEVVNNQPPTDDQAARIIDVKPQNPAAAAGAAAPDAEH